MLLSQTYDLILQCTQCTNHWVVDAIAWGGCITKNGWGMEWVPTKTMDGDHRVRQKPVRLQYPYSFKTKIHSSISHWLTDGHLQSLQQSKYPIAMHCYKVYWHCIDTGIASITWLYLSSYKAGKFSRKENSTPYWFQFWPPGGTNSISSKFTHQMAPLALVRNLH